MLTLSTIPGRYRVSALWWFFCTVCGSSGFILHILPAAALVEEGYGSVAMNFRGCSREQSPEQNLPLCVTDDLGSVKRGHRDVQPGCHLTGGLFTWWQCAVEVARRRTRLRYDQSRSGRINTLHIKPMFSSHVVWCSQLYGGYFTTKNCCAILASSVRRPALPMK